MFDVILEIIALTTEVAKLVSFRQKTIEGLFIDIIGKL